jgi:protocatechuate 3,4-dioxygenase beta subunit
MTLDRRGSQVDNDDQPIGRILSRREVLTLFGAAGATLLIGCSTDDSDDDPATSTTTASGAGDTTATTQATAPEQTTGAANATSALGATATSAEASTASSTTETAAATVAVLPACVVVPELTEGPYFVDELLNRSDIRPDPSSGAVSEGTPLVLTFRVSRITAQGCVAYAGAVVDIWHCDAFGVYSDASDRSFNTIGQQFLRGYQVTDQAGIATFTTIYPGWYQGRAVHIHFKIRSEATDNSALEFTSQFFFDESLTDMVHAEQPYASKGVRTLLNEGDGIYQETDGLLTLVCTETTDGYASTFDVGIQTA